MSIALVQQATGGIANATSGSSTLHSVSAGDLLTLLIAGYFNAYTVSSITDNLGNTWTKAASSAINDDAEIWYAANVKAGNTTVTIKFSGSQYASWNFAEWSGATGTLDTHSSNSGSTSPATTGAINTANANDLILGVIAPANANPGTFTDTGTSDGTPNALNWDPKASADMYGGAAYQIVSATGNYNFSASSNGSWDAAIAAFKGATVSSITLSGTFAQTTALSGAGNPAGTGALNARIGALAAAVLNSAAALSTSGTFAGSAEPAGISALGTAATLSAAQAPNAVAALSEAAQFSAGANLESLNSAVGAGFVLAGAPSPQSAASLSANGAFTAGALASAIATAAPLLNASGLGLVAADGDAGSGQALQGAAFGASQGAVAQTLKAQAAASLTPFSLSFTAAASGAADAAGAAVGGLGLSLGLSAQAALVAQVIELFAALAASFGVGAEVQAQAGALAELIAALASTLSAPTIAAATLATAADGQVTAALSASVAAGAELPAGVSIAAGGQIAASPSMAPTEIVLAGMAAALTWKIDSAASLVTELVALLEQTQAISAAAAQTILAIVALRASAPLAPSLVIEAPLAGALALESGLAGALALLSPLASAMALENSLSPALIIAGAV